MRNPFQHREEVSEEATAQVGETASRLEGVEIVKEAGVDRVMVDISATNRLLDRWVDQQVEAHGMPSDAEMAALTVAAFNDPANWKRTEGDRPDAGDYEPRAIDWATARLRDPLPRGVTGAPN